MGDDGQDRRGGKRETLALKVEYAGASDLVADYTQNISRGGTFVLTNRALEKGTPISLVLSFPGLIKPLTLQGVVRWVRDEPGAERGVGVEFDLEDADARARLDRLVIQIAGGHPDVVERTLRVLVIEDNPHVSKLIREGLVGGSRRQLGTKVNFQFTSVSNGREALEALHAERFDFLIVDVYLPILDGASVIQEVRANRKLQSLPIVAVSAGGKSAREEALKAGADFFLDKPMRLVDIVSTMRKLTGID